MSIKLGTWNILEHQIIKIIMRKMCKIKLWEIKLNRNKLVSDRKIKKKTKQNKTRKQRRKKENWKWMQWVKVHNLEDLSNIDSFHSFLISLITWQSLYSQVSFLIENQARLLCSDSLNRPKNRCTRVWFLYSFQYVNLKICVYTTPH